MESRVVVTRSCRWKYRGDIVQRVQTFSDNINKFGDLMGSIVIIANNAVSHT